MGHDGGLPHLGLTVGRLRGGIGAHKTGVAIAAFIGGPGRFKNLGDIQTREGSSPVGIQRVMDRVTKTSEMRLR